MKERRGGSALNIDGALRYGSIRQPLSHNYTSASGRMIHHMDTHDCILRASRGAATAVYRRTAQRRKRGRI